MTRELAIKTIKKIRDYLCGGNPIFSKDLVAEALNIAIKALEQEPSCRVFRQVDLISRADTLEILHAMANVDKDNAKVYSKIYSQIKDAPSVVPKRGKWLDAREEDPWWFICSECKTMVDADYNYCPHCGADMRGDTE